MTTMTTPTSNKKLPLDPFSQFQPGDTVLIGSVEVEWGHRTSVPPFKVYTSDSQRPSTSTHLPGIKSAWKGTFIKRVGTGNLAEVALVDAPGTVFVLPVGYVKPLDYPVEDAMPSSAVRKQ